MKRRIRPAWLLRQADELAYREGGPGQPRNTNLRRATSAAYYALFHAMSWALARHLLPDGSDEELAHVCRALEHGALQKACGWVAKGEKPPDEMTSVVAAAKQDPRVVDIADALLELRVQRHAADYDHMADFTKPGVLSLIDMARDAVEKLDDLQTAQSPALKRLLTLVALRTGIR